MTCTLRSLGPPDWTRLHILVSEALAEGHSFPESLLADLLSGANRFEGPGEVLLGAFDGSTLIAVGGLNRDPYTEEVGVGRIRRVYVLCGSRGTGVGTLLVRALMSRAAPHYHTVALRAATEDAGRFFEELGFSPSSVRNGATHVWAPPNPASEARGALSQLS